MNSQSRTPQLINNSSNEERPPECSGCKVGLGRGLQAELLPGAGGLQ